ncbi:2-keto-4-pentenoate hydratase/2-oxohepta-3-ene-1,7-dioic acid hydratase (catechol pathway) [Variovorax sp. YR752]|uniref:fumarylacetoacetate hydrolase family protein n=1 Tax=unclassified Variovorax TaxID=663243 RepID=UPI000BDC4AB9|nr:fumarylacetoacetate hydrolase family protein [Variovorax sp. YR752]SOE06284.1 2-keto-4-pentenoate hydratase/2-oxohepta-3-ene-1,7-dioic acid hydratase (catechol pathway) [Variovorax sp. YR752]
MKLFRHGPEGLERPGAVDAAGNLRDLSLLVPDLTPEWMSPEKLGALRAVQLEQLPLVLKGARLGTPVAGTRQFVAVGLNYRKHAAESGLEVPKEPVVFTKALTSLAGPNDDVTIPDGSESTDWEIELGVVIGTQARRVTRDSALGHVAGYCLANDVSERDWQIKRNGQWGKGKSFDGFGPIGPWLVTSDEIPDPQSIPLELKVNDQVRQRSNTADMIFSVAEIVSYLSQFMTLLPGDVVITGTPEGVGLGMKPPRFLGRGDIVTLDGGVLGTQRQHFV